MACYPTGTIRTTTQKCSHTSLVIPSLPWLRQIATRLPVLFSSHPTSGLVPIPRLSHRARASASARPSKASSSPDPMTASLRHATQPYATSSYKLLHVFLPVLRQLSRPLLALSNTNLPAPTKWKLLSRSHANEGDQGSTATAPPLPHPHSTPLPP